MLYFHLLLTQKEIFFLFCEKIKIFYPLGMNVVNSTCGNLARINQGFIFLYYFTLE